METSPGWDEWQVNANMQGIHGLLDKGEEQRFYALSDLIFQFNICGRLKESLKEDSGILFVHFSSK